MEDFYKKHGFDIQQTNRRNRRFHIVRYYPKIQTYEFINVGIILYDKHEVFYRLLQSDEISKLHCPSLIESKVLRNSLDSLDKYMQKQQELNTVLEDVSKRYKRFAINAASAMRAIPMPRHQRRWNGSVLPVCLTASPGPKVVVPSGSAKAWSPTFRWEPTFFCISSWPMRP